VPEPQLSSVVGTGAAVLGSALSSTRKIQSRCPGRQRNQRLRSPSRFRDCRRADQLGLGSASGVASQALQDPNNAAIVRQSVGPDPDANTPVRQLAVGALASEQECLLRIFARAVANIPQPISVGSTCCRGEPCYPRSCRFAF